jgi:hypothetical protein
MVCVGSAAGSMARPNDIIPEIPDRVSAALRMDGRRPHGFAPSAVQQCCGPMPADSRWR